jgi:hypothetical protein
MRVSRDGHFSLDILSEGLSVGLRGIEANPRNSSAMVELVGMVGIDKVLQTIDQLSSIDTSVITDGFPYPQLFILSNHILVCGQTDIYEYRNSVLEHKVTVAAGTTWRVLDYIDYICMSNGNVTVERNYQTGIFAITSEQPTFYSSCDFNGQALISNPEGS